MQIELNAESRAKLEDILEQVYTRHDMQDLSPEELIDALLDLGVDLLVAEDASMPLARGRLLNYCGKHVEARYMGA